MFWLMYICFAIAGFFVGIEVIPRIREYFNFDERVFYTGFIIFTIFTLFIGFFLVNTLYYSEISLLRSTPDQKLVPYICLFELFPEDCQKNALSLSENTGVYYFPIDYWSKLRENAYMYFMNAMVIGVVITIGNNIRKNKKEAKNEPI